MGDLPFRAIDMASVDFRRSDCEIQKCELKLQRSSRLPDILVIEFLTSAEISPNPTFELPFRLY